MGSNDDTIAIVGAGLSGLYCALRLCDNGHPGSKITLYEANRRVGGRIMTATNPLDGTMSAELGARLIKEDHPLVRNLVKRFGLSPHFIEQDHGKRLFKLRGRFKTERQIRRSYLTRAFDYDVRPNVQRRSPRRIVEKALGRAGEPGFADLPLDQFWPEVFKGEEAAFISHRIGYSFFTEPLNTAATLDWAYRSFFGGAYHGISGGMGGLTGAIADELLACGVVVRTGQTVEQITPSAGHGSIVISGSNSANRGTGDEFDRVILAVPPKAIGRIGGVGEMPEIRKLASRVRSWPIFTASLFYPRPWWNAKLLEPGGFCTDGPLGHLSFSSGATTGATGVIRHARIDLYADGWRHDHWRKTTLDLKPETWLGGDNAFAASLTAELADAFGGRAGNPPPIPEAVIFQDWHEGRVGAGIHLWEYGSTPDRHVAMAARPVADLPIHLCNEAWSIRHGWMEGALESAENVLTQAFDLPPASTE